MHSLSENACYGSERSFSVFCFSSSFTFSAPERAYPRSHTTNVPLDQNIFFGAVSKNNACYVTIIEIPFQCRAQKNGDRWVDRGKRFQLRFGTMSDLDNDEFQSVLFVGVRLQHLGFRHCDRRRYSRERTVQS